MSNTVDLYAIDGVASPLVVTRDENDRDSVIVTFDEVTTPPLSLDMLRERLSLAVAGNPQFGNLSFFMHPNSQGLRVTVRDTDNNFAMGVLGITRLRELAALFPDPAADR